MEIDKYLGIFIDESKENLQKLNESLLLLEENPDSLDLLNDIFRVAHTLKGMSRTMGYNDIADVTHHMENVLDPMRSGDLEANSSVVDTLFKCLDKLEELVELVIDGTYKDKQNEINSLVKELKQIELSINKAPVKIEPEKNDFNEYEIEAIKNALKQGLKIVEIFVTVTEDCVLPAARAYMVVNASESFGEILKATPSVEDLEQGEFESDFKLFLVTQKSNDEILKALNGISELKEIKIKEIKANDINSIGKPEEQQSSESETIKEVKNDSQTAQVKSPTKVVPQTIRVNADRLDKLMNLVGELVINRTRISELSTDLNVNELSSAIGLMGNITTDIQEIVMKLRMVQIEQVFNRFPRLVRDISKSQNKDINLKITGKETEIDRVVVDEIGDPLVHLIRNSLDHGLEKPEERIQAGKAAKGTLELSAFNEGDNIMIKVVDDGRGINPEKILAKAIQKGIITNEQARTFNERETLELIFAPGFSTVEVATDISGRGVGMDVVKQKVNSLGGNVSISSKVGEGTTIIISLPSTMAIVQALLIKVEEEIYATPLNYISEVIDIKTNEIKNVQNKEVIVLRGHTLPLVRLNNVLNVETKKQNNDEPLTVVIVKCQNKYLGVIVSELIGQQEVVIKPINKNLSSGNFISGATTLGNGKVALILNVNALF